jgi:DNA-3-methyladenine glycosylase II
MPDLSLDHARLRAATAILAERDPDLGGIVARLGSPPLWDRPPGLATLIAIVLEQQVSLRSGAAAFERLRLAAGAVEAGPIVALGETGARAAGLTRQKARYVVGLAEAAIDGRLDVAAIAAADDDAARERLTDLLGIERSSSEPPSRGDPGERSVPACSGMPISRASVDGYAPVHRSTERIGSERL